MNKKVVFLLLALVLPISIFIFLRLFGKNQFDIPVYYAEGVTDADTPCKVVYAKPYTVPDSILIQLGWAKDVGATVVLTGSIPDEALEMRRLREDYSEKEVAVTSAVRDAELTQARKARINDCVLLVKSPFNCLLIDSEKRIRGYYNLSTREEMDRLNVEIKILLKEY